MLDDNDDSSSSGIFTDERQLTESKETLSALEVLSIESIADSQASFNHFQILDQLFIIIEDQCRVCPTNDDLFSTKTNFCYRQSHRSHSADGILNDNQTTFHSQTSHQQSSAANDNPNIFSKQMMLEKAGLVRITNDTYRLTVENLHHLSHSRKTSTHSFVPYSNDDDSLRSAKE